MMSLSDSKISKLPNSLIEMCVVVGMDDDTGLKYSRRSHAQPDRGDGIGEIFRQPMEPSVLAVISNQLAYFPQSKVQVDPFYPPIAAVTTPMSPASSQGFAPHAMRSTTQTLISHSQTLINQTESSSISSYPASQVIALFKRQDPKTIYTLSC
ncbi:uncharacterized protein [Amphiura filiformis]|uniref:uncharacterized protein n=1 Tax=Amphiura filiformis TaxID=82378 RepID=UPI003B221AC8